MTSTTRVSNIVVFGKARKVHGGESERPKDVLTAPLVPLDKPPRPLKLAEILDWTICHGAESPAVWIVTVRAWYRLGEPTAAYLRNYGVMQRRLAFCHVTADALRRDYELSLEAALRVLVEVPLVDGDLVDPKYRAHFEAQAEAIERAKEEAAVGILYDTWFLKQHKKMKQKSYSTPSKKWDTYCASVPFA